MRQLGGMWLYSLGYGHYEGGKAILLLHPTRLSPVRWKRMVFESTLSVCRKRVMERDRWDTSVGEDRQYHCTFEYLLGDIAKDLCKKGFTRISVAPSHSFCVFGWNDLMEDGSWSHDSSPLTKELAAYIQANLAPVRQDAPGKENKEEK